MARYLVTPALPYANGPLHIGHMVEHVQVDVFVRALRMAGDDVLFVCGADSHGTPIEINAAKQGVAPAEFVAQWHASHANSLSTFDVEFDEGYGSTHTDENAAVAGQIFEAAVKAGHIEKREIQQLFDPEAKRFLPDRMVRGTCPKCKTPDQYGDGCEACGSTYAPTELLDPHSVFSSAAPVMKPSEHYFFKLGPYADKVKAYLADENVVDAGVRHFLDGWFKEGLKDWDISRDGPYFGVKIPGEDDKYFYVWMDAPIGYISLAERAAKARGLTADDFWKNDDVRIVHFIGKDIIYFHTLFWPALLMTGGYRLPDQIAVHGMLTVDGKKMSKSRGTFIGADLFAKHVEPSALRYYLACKLNGGIGDVDLNLEDFKNRVNADLVNKIVNILSRTVPMLHKHNGGATAAFADGTDELRAAVREIAGGIEALYRDRDTASVVREVVRIAELGNKYLQDAAPWATAKTDKALAAKQLTTALWTGRACVALLKPILPRMAEAAEAMFDLGAFTFENAAADLPEGTALGQYPRLFNRIKDAELNALTAEAEAEAAARAAKSAPKGKKAAPSDTPAAKEAPKSVADPADEITFDQFVAVDLRAARVLSAEDIKGSKKLLKLQLDVGPLGKRQVMAGLKPHYTADDLVGKMVVMVANLPPRKMKLGLSEGMVVAAGKVPTVLSAEGAFPGERVS